MSKLQQYINDNYEGNPLWFEEEVKTQWQMDRINESLDMMEYLDGQHKILKRGDEIWKGKRFKTRKIVLQICKPILTFQKSFLLKNPVTLTSSDNDETLEQYKEIYKKGKYDNIDDKILDALLKYGEVFEYLYLDDDKKIKSNIIKAVDSYPVINSKGEYVGFIEHYISRGISYYTIYTEAEVIEYSDRGGDLHRIAEHTNISGLPVWYLLPSESDEFKARSDMKDWINLIDEIEDLVSKYADSFYKFLSPLPVMTGTKLSTGKDGEGAINPNLVGQVLQLEHMSEFDYKTAKMDYQSFKEEYKILEKNLLNISMTPSISMSGLEIANVSTDSIKIMFYMAIAKANMIAKHLYEGMDERWKAMKGMLELVDGKEYEGYISGVFKFDIPSNDTEVVDNLVKLDSIGKISTEQLLSLSPYCHDVTTEIERLIQEVDNEEEPEDKAQGNG